MMAQVLPFLGLRFIQFNLVLVRVKRPSLFEMKDGKRKGWIVCVHQDQANMTANIPKYTELISGSQGNITRFLPVIDLKISISQCTINLT